MDELARRGTRFELYNEGDAMTDERYWPDRLYLLHLSMHCGNWTRLVGMPSKFASQPLLSLFYKTHLVDRMGRRLYIG
jgi:hypothetical protein